MSDRGNDLWSGDEGIPGIAIGVDNCLAGVPDAVIQLVGAQILPDGFGWIELWRVGRERQQNDIAGQFQAR